MGATIKNLILGYIGSKKFVALVAGGIVTLLAKYKFEADPLVIQGLIAMIVAYLVGQGIADNGKEAAKVKPAQVEATTLKPTT
jgi:hypothetical protein